MSEENKGKTNWTINTVATLICMVLGAGIAWRTYQVSTKQEENSRLLENIGLKQDLALTQLQNEINKSYVSKSEFQAQFTVLNATDAKLWEKEAAQAEKLSAQKDEFNKSVSEINLKLQKLLDSTSK